MKKILLFCAFVVSLLAQSAPPSHLTGESLKEWFRNNTYTNKHNQLGYSAAREKMYNFIDNKNNTITGVYSGYQKSWTYGGSGTNPNPINCEHTVPQSFFGKSEPMKSDIHHLFPTYDDWNNERGSNPFGEINDSDTEKWMRLSNEQTSIPSSNIDEYSESTSSTFEPREDQKGNTARAIFYFYTMYPTQAGDISSVGDINELYQWHLDDPVDSEEIDRNDKVEIYQGNRNPYIDFPGSVAKAFGFSSVSFPPAAPQNVAFSSTASEIRISWIDVSDETSYSIYRSTDNSNFQKLVTLQKDITSYTDNSVSVSTTYFYYLTASNKDGTSEKSSIVSGQLSTSSANGTVIISEYVEGSSYNKAIELANISNSSVDLSEYSLKKQTNGSGNWGSAYTLSGRLSSGNVYAVANSDASSSLKSKTNASSDHDVFSFNGNDPVGLFHNNVLIDVVGNFNGGSSNFAKDVTLRRNLSVSNGRTTYLSSEWTEFSKNDFSGIGFHSETTSTELDFFSSPSHSAIGETSVKIEFVANSLASAKIKYGTSAYYMNNSVSLEEQTSFSEVISELSEDTKYYYQVILIKGSKVISSSIKEFRTLEASGFSKNYEPNDSFSDAGLLTVGTSIYSFIQSSGDDDYYEFSISEPGAINITLSGFSGDYDVYLYDDSYDELGKAYTTNEPEIIDYKATEKGIFYVKVTGYKSASSTSDDYELLVTFTEESENQWYSIDYVIESDHNYSNNASDIQSYHQEGAKQVAVHFTRLETEKDFDFVHIEDKNGNRVETYHGSQDDFWAVVSGDKINIHLETDYALTKWGYHIDKVAYYSDRKLYLAKTSSNRLLASVYQKKEGIKTHINASKGFEINVFSSKEKPDKIPNQFKLGANYPNPFNPITRIPFNLKKGEVGTIKIFNSIGQLIKSINVSSDKQEIIWNATNSFGKRVGSGIYFYQLISGKSKSAAKQMILIK